MKIKALILIDYSNKVQEALHQGNNDEYNTLVDKYGKNKATYKEIEESFSSIVDGMLKRDALFNAVYLSGINVIIKYLALLIQLEYPLANLYLMKTKLPKLTASN